MKIDKLLDRAASPDLLEPDLEAILIICDAIRSNEAQVKPSLIAIQRKCHSENPHVAHHSLLVLECVVKNCGKKVHDEVATKEFMEDMKHLALEGGEKVKEKVLELIQCWAHAFRDQPEYSIVKDTLNLMKMEGYTFPQLKESDAMFAAESAPEWVDADNCYRCRVQFGMLTRKHHCRNCGQIFCDKCSNRQVFLPQYGIEKEVRVCETCFDKLNKKTDDKVKETPGPGVISDDAKKQEAQRKEEELKRQEEEELQLALALSQSEQEEKERLRKRHTGTYPTHGSTNSFSTASQSQPPAATNGGQSDALNYKGAMDSTSGYGEAEGELARYLNRKFWDQKRDQLQHQPAGTTTTGTAGILRASPTPSAPFAEPDKHMNGEMNEKMQSNKEQEAFQNGEVDDLSDFVNGLRGNIDVFVNRIRSNQARGRSLLNDSSIQALFMNLTAQHSQLLKHLQALDDKRGHSESLQDKLAQIKDAREAVNSLREEHEQRRQAELAEQQRLRQQQMMAKLDVMRKQKHEWLEQQRLLAIQQMQERQREMEFQKQMRQQGIMQPPPYGMPYGIQQQPQVSYGYQPPGMTYPAQASVPIQQPVQTQQYQPAAAPNVMPQVYNMQAVANSIPPQSQIPQSNYAPMQATAGYNVQQATPWLANNYGQTGYYSGPVGSPLPVPTQQIQNIPVMQNAQTVPTYAPPPYAVANPAMGPVAGLPQQQYLPANGAAQMPPQISQVQEAQLISFD